MDKQEIYSKIKEYFRDKPVKKVTVFGSYSTGDETKESDIDLVLDLEHPVGLMQLSRYKQDLEDRLHIKVDLGTSKGISRHAVSSVNETSSIVYEA